MGVDAKRFRQWVERYGDELFAWCGARVAGYGDRTQLARDLLQDTFTEAWRNRHIFEGTDEQARPFLYQVLKYQISNFHRRLHRRRVTSQ